MKATFDVSTLKRYISRVNGYPRDEGETELRERPLSGKSAAAIN